MKKNQIQSRSGIKIPEKLFFSRQKSVVSIFSKSSPMPKFISVIIKKKDFYKMVKKRIMDFNFNHLNLLLIWGFPLVPYIKMMRLSVVGIIVLRTAWAK